MKRKKAPVVQIKRWDGTVLWSSDKATVLEAVVEAVAAGAYLLGANLSGANLSGAYLSGANLSGANLSGAYLSGAAAYVRRLANPLQLLRDQVGPIRLFKLTTSDAKSPMSGTKLSYAVGATVANDADEDETKECSHGIHVATLDWCIKQYLAEGRNFSWRLFEVEFSATDIAAIPYGGDGKIRVHR
ncbi:MAG TPA: pentapeptide repeat-containing protein, partial [Planctomycetota bacterium]|nr:pentapeptide repeat-containing protein [Planctomycetota bacterium]